MKRITTTIGNLFVKDRDEANELARKVEKITTLNANETVEHYRVAEPGMKPVKLRITVEIEELS